MFFPSLIWQDGRKLTVHLSVILHRYYVVISTHFSNILIFHKTEFLSVM